MKSIEQVRNEYLLHEAPIGEAEYDKEDIINYVKSFLMELDEEKLDILKTIKANCRNKLFTRLRNLFSSFEEDISFYDKDNTILNEELDLILIYKYYLTLIENVLNEDNKEEVYKLFDFTSKSYNDNLNYFEEKRDIISYERSLIFYQGVSEEEYILSFQEFFKEEIERLGMKKIGYEKVKS